VMQVADVILNNITRWGNVTAQQTSR
jgi:hypothetical protein